MIRDLTLVLITAFAIALVSGCSPSQDDQYDTDSTAEVTGRAKYVFVFIGDGMGLPQISAAEAFLACESGIAVGQERLSFAGFPAQGLTTTFAEDRFITGSAASATAIACGEKTTIGTIAMDGTHSRNLTTLAELAKYSGMRVGFVSSVDVDHATPAAFYAHSPSREEYYDIGLQLADSDYDYVAGGRVRVEKTPDGQPTVLDVMAENGWTIADTREEFEALSAGDGQVYAYNFGFADDAMLYEIDRTDEVSLAEFTAKGIELLYDGNGFFMMVEGGKIDWACHANDAVSAIYDTIAFDAAVREALEFYAEHPDETLIVVTGDHECGGLTLGYAGTGYESAFSVLADQRNSYEYFDEYILGPFKAENDLSSVDPDSLLPLIEEYFGLSDLTEYETGLIETSLARSMMNETERAGHTETALLYSEYEPLTVTLTHILNNRAGLSWTSFSHTGVPVPTFAIGVGADQFNGYYDNTDIFHKVVAVMGSGVSDSAL